MAGGQGTRLRPLTDHQPKCLVPVAGKPIIDRILNELPDFVDEAVVVIGYLGHQVREHLQGYTKHKLTFVEVEPLGTGYAIKACEPHITGKFLALNGDDIYDKNDLAKLGGHDFALLVKPIENETRFGHLTVDDAGNFADILPGQPDQTNLANIGAYALTPEYFSWPLAKTKAGEFGLPHTLLAQAKAGRAIRVLEAEHWFPIGFPQDIPAAEAYLASIGKA